MRRRSLDIEGLSALNRQSVRVAGPHHKVEIAYALHRTPRQQMASVKAFRGSGTGRHRAPSAASSKRPDEPNAAATSGAISRGSITLADHFGSEADCGCGGPGA